MSVDFGVDFSEYLEALRESLDSFVADARKAGLDAPVPTAPEWDVRQLIAHQGMVHRWATDCMQGKRVDPSAYEAEGLESDDPVMWLREGGLRLIKALKEAPVDLEAFVFLNDAPRPALFWARRQCHETTIHSVDALAATLGRMPTADETWVTQQVALDGIDELLTGFMTAPEVHAAQRRAGQPLDPAQRRRAFLAGARQRPSRPSSSAVPAGQRRWRRDDADMVLEGTGRAALPRAVEPVRRGDAARATTCGVVRRTSPGPDMTEVLVPPPRLARWVENFGARHGGHAAVDAGLLSGVAADGSTFVARLPFGRAYDGSAAVEPFVESRAAPPDDWGVLLVRKGGFAVARLAGDDLVESKVGQRHVQGRTKAGGQSQQRFARRRDNQARVAYEAAAEHAARILGGVPLLVTGGDHAAVEAVLADRRLAGVGRRTPVPRRPRPAPERAGAGDPRCRQRPHQRRQRRSAPGRRAARSPSSGSAGEGPSPLAVDDARP